MAWEFRERSAGGPHTVDFKLEFVEPGMQPGVSALSGALSPNALSLSLSAFAFAFALLQAMPGMPGVLVSLLSRSLRCNHLYARLVPFRS